MGEALRQQGTKSGLTHPLPRTVVTTQGSRSALGYLPSPQQQGATTNHRIPFGFAQGRLFGNRQPLFVRFWTVGFASAQASLHQLCAISYLR